ncbi:MAG: hypothetical protein PHW90_04090 [Bacilli bacterium]|nr:hypothetical protein [Bacilli bacterium]
MKKQINRYTISFVVENKLIPFAMSNLKNIDLLSTYFVNKDQLIDFLVKRANVSLPVTDLIVTYKYDCQTKQAPLLFSNHADIVGDKQLVSKMISYLSNHGNVTSIDLGNIDNDFLEKAIYKLMKQPYPYTNYAMLYRFAELLNKNYKLKRDLALFLEEKMIKEGTKLLTPPQAEDDAVMEYIIASCLSRFDILEPFKSDMLKKFTYTPPSDKDAYIDDYRLIAEYDALEILEDLRDDILFEDTGKQK